MDNISNKMAKGAVWMVAFKMLERSIGLISTIILARLLEPGDFGLVALATAFLGLLTLLTSFSFDVALIHKQNADRNLYDTAWTFNVIFGILLGITLLIAAIPLAEFYKETRLESILYVLAFSTFMGGFTNIGPVAFRKDLQFHKEFYFLLAKKLIGFTVCMSLAFTLHNYWALVWGTFASQILEVFLSYAVHPFRPKFCLNGRKELFGFSMWLFINNTLFFIHSRMADFIVSKLLGSHVLGVYTISYELANLPTTELVAPINRAVLPGYTKMADDLEVMRQGFLNVLAIIALFAIPASLGISAIAEVLVKVVLGDKWFETVSLIQIFSISGLFIALQTNASVIYNAIGKPRYMSMISLFNILFLFIPALYFLIQLHGVLGIAEAYLISSVLIWPINYSIIKRLINIKWKSILLVIWRPIFSGLIMYFFIVEYTQILNESHPIENQVLKLFIMVLSGAFVYIVTDILLWSASRFPDGAEKFIFKKLKQS